jgi:hypothetical protein
LRQIAIMTAHAALLTAAALAAAAPAGAQTAPRPASPGSFSSLWVPWNVANSASIQAEGDRQAPAEGAGPLRAGSAALGQRVGDMVREGDCEGGERLARSAGDLPLVEAVRAHCRGGVPAMSRH